MATSIHVLLISGSLRRGSTNTAALRTLAATVTTGVEAVLHDGLAALPAFDPDLDVDPLPAPVAALRGQIHRADAVLFSAPEYAGALPGSFKNLLDWTIGDDQPGSIYEKPVAWINTSARGAPGAHQELRTVLAYAHATVVEPACASVPVLSDQVGPDGLVGDPDVGHELARTLAALVAHVAEGRRAGG